MIDAVRRCCYGTIMQQPDRPPPRLLGEAGSIRLFHRPGQGPATLILFAAAAPDGAVPPGMAPAGWGEILFESRAPEGYAREAMQALIGPALSAAGPRRVTHGAGLGGHAALKYAGALGATAALALSPLYSIDPVDMPGEALALRAFDGRRHAGMAVAAADLPPVAIFGFDPLDPRDAAHAARLSAVGGLSPVALRHAAAAPAMLAEAGGLQAVLEAALDGEAARATGLLRAARRGSPSLRAAVAVSAAARGREGWAQALAPEAERAARLGPARVLDLAARSLGRAGRHKEAAARLRDLVALEPAQAEPLLRLADALIAQQEVEAALEAIRAAVALDPANPLPHARHVACLRELRRTEEAIEAARAAVAAAPRRATAQVLLGETLAWARRRAGAQQAFARAIALDPGHDLAQFGRLAAEAPGEAGEEAAARLAALLDRMAGEGAPEGRYLALVEMLQAGNRQPAALEAARRGAAAHPGAPALLLRLGALEFAANRPEAAEAAYRAATQAAPDLAAGWLGLTEVLGRRRQAPEARAVAAAAVAAHPRHALLAARHALVLAAAGEVAAAEQEARRAVALDAREEAAHLALADALWRQQRLKDAVRAMEAASALLPGSGTIAARLGHLLISQDRRAAAVSAFERAVAAGRAPAHVWLGLTDALWRLDRVAEAQEAARRGAAAHPGHAELRARLAQLLLAAGEETEARATLADAMAAEPESEDVRLAMADALWRQGRRAEALAAAREAVAAAPDKPAVADRLGHLLLEAGQFEEAAAIFTRVTEQAPRLVSAWVGLSDAERERKRIPPAIEACRRAQEAGADRHTMRLLRFRLYGDMEE